jgi:hypothetical protein
MVPSVFSKTTQNRANYIDQCTNKKNKLRSFNAADFYEVLARK